VAVAGQQYLQNGQALGCYSMAGGFDLIDKIVYVAGRIKQNGYLVLRSTPFFTNNDYL